MDITELVEEYLSLRDRQADVDVEQLVERAGPLGPELRDQIAVFSRLEELARTIEEPRPEERTPENIGRFHILRSLGRGGLSRVFLAEDGRLGRKVALKVLHPSSLRSADAEQLHAVSREGRSLAKLKHPGIVSVHEIDAVDGHAYVAMEYVDGPSLFDVLSAMRELAGHEPGPDLPPTAYKAARALASPAAKCSLVAQIARALHTCHQNGVVHRDVKPGNVLLDAEHQPKLADFGLAHLESGEDSQGHTEALVGTAPYVAPEQVDQERTGASPASDQFSLGVVLYELLTLENPFARATRAATMTAISRAEPPGVRKRDATIHADVERICAHCLEREPGARYTDLAALAQDLENFVEHRPIGLRAPSPWRRIRLWGRRNRTTLGRTAAAALGALLLGSALSAGALVRERSAVVEARQATESAAANCGSASELADLYLEAERQRQRSAALDRDFWAWLLPPLSGASNRALDACSQRLAALLEEELEPPISEERRAQAIERYRSALDLDRRLCAELLYNERHRNRGYLEIAPAEPGGSVSVWRIDESSRLTTVALEPGRPRTLPEGVYRLRYEDPGASLPRELDFESRPAALQRLLVPRALLPELAADMLPIEARGDEPGFLICRSLVTWEAFRRVMPEEYADLFQSIPWLDEQEQRPTDPAVVPWDMGLKYASIVGARMPTVTERARAAEQGLPMGALGGEWTATPAGDLRSRYSPRSVDGALRNGIAEDTALRLAIGQPAPIRGPASAESDPPKGK